MSDLKNEDELNAEADAQFPDQMSEFITPARLRNYVKTLNASALIQRAVTVNMTGPIYAVPVSEVTENILHFTSGQTLEVQLPDASLVPDQVFVMLTGDTSPVTVTSVSAINGDAAFNEGVLASYRAIDGEWFALPLYFSRQDTVEVSIMFNEPGSLTAGEEMRLGNVEGQDNEGWIAPFGGKLVKCTISRGDSDLADIDIQVNNSTEDTIITNSVKSTHNIDIDVSEGDSVMVLGGSSTPNALSHPVVVLILRKS